MTRFLLFLVGAMAMAQTPFSIVFPTAPPSPFIVQISYDTDGKMRLTQLTQGAGVTLVGTVLTATVAPAQPTSVSLLSLTKASPQPTDSWSGAEEWCLSTTSTTTPPSSYPTGTFFFSAVTATNPTVSPSVSSVYFEEGAVSLAVTGGVSNPVPTWVLNRAECANGPALMLTPAQATTPTALMVYTRSAVKIVAVH